MPPATRATSPPAPSDTPQPRPYGPRTPSRSPGAASHRALVTQPTSRTVWVRVPGRPGSPLIEIGTSPTPNAWSIVNWPAANGRALPSAAVRSRVTVSWVSLRVPVTRKGCGSQGSVSTGPAATRSAGMVGAVQVEHPDPGGLQAAVHHLRHPLHEGVA